MPPASFRVQIPINAAPAKVYAYVSDLTRHGEWSSDPVQIIALTSGPVTAGSRYRSTAQSHGVTFNTELEVTEYNPPSRFAFEGEDGTGKFSHVFTFQAQGGGTLVTRRIQFEATLIQWLVFLAVLYPVRIPSAKRTLQQLKQKMEGLR
jgi:uncharacterized protein YndB with AHSA1/START domain